MAKVVRRWCDDWQPRHDFRGGQNARSLGPFRSETFRLATNALRGKKKLSTGKKIVGNTFGRAYFSQQFVSDPIGRK